MRYVIVSVVNGPAGQFNNALRDDIFKQFGAKSSKLPAHFTIVPPFEHDGSIVELENVIKSQCQNYCCAPYTVNGFDHFDNRVIYMAVNMSTNGIRFHDALCKGIASLHGYNFRNIETESSKKVFHVTVSSKKLPPLYNDVYNYVNKLQNTCNFDCLFDNVTIYRWDNVNCTWRFFKQYSLLTPNKK